MVEIDVRDRNQPSFEFLSAQGPEDMDMNLKDMLPGLFGQRTKKRKMKVAEAFEYLVQEEEQRLIDMDQVTRLAVERVEDSGIVFLDEIDKIAGREGGHGPDVSREGVQRDILPIVEGTTVNTKYGMVSTDHILFIAAGAFHVSKPSDLIPELQGRFPIRVELKSLTVEDFIRILTEPKSSLVKQSTALLETEGLKLEFTPEALAEMAQFAFRVNETTENIGARRLHTIMERVLDEISFQAPDLFKSPRAEATQEGVIAEVGASAPLTSEPQKASPPLPVIERKKDDGTMEKVIVVDPEYVTPAGGVDCEGPGPEPLYFVIAAWCLKECAGVRAALPGRRSVGGVRRSGRVCAAASWASSEPVVPVAAGLLQVARMCGEAVGCGGGLGRGFGEIAGELGALADFVELGGVCVA